MWQSLTFLVRRRHPQIEYVTGTPSGIIGATASAAGVDASADTPKKEQFKPTGFSVPTHASAERIIQLYIAR